MVDGLRSCGGSSNRTWPLASADRRPPEPAQAPAGFVSLLVLPHSVWRLGGQEQGADQAQRRRGAGRHPEPSPQTCGCLAAQSDTHRGLGFGQPAGAPGAGGRAGQTLIWSLFAEQSRSRSPRSKAGQDHRDRQGTDHDGRVASRRAVAVPLGPSSAVASPSTTRFRWRMPGRRTNGPPAGTSGARSCSRSREGESPNGHRLPMDCHANGPDVGQAEVLTRTGAPNTLEPNVRG